MFFSKKAQSPKRLPLDIVLYRAGDGTLRLFPSVRMRNGPSYILPEMTALSPPYRAEDIGQAILDLWAKWEGVQPLEHKPESNFWSVVPKCRSYRAFHRSHQMISIDLGDAPKFTLLYMARRQDGGYGQDLGEVELRAQFHREMPKLPLHLGQAVEKIFMLADVFDPLP